MVLLHIQKTGGTSFEKHLVQDLIVKSPCLCRDERRRCLCLRQNSSNAITTSTTSEIGSIRNVTWLFSRFTTGWICGLHADWTQLSNCLDKLDQLYFLTFIRNPLDRFLSEFRHVQRGATWRNSRKHCQNYDTQLCYAQRQQQSNWVNVSLEEFLDCPNNMAINRQTRMLANHNLIKCSNDHTNDQEMLASAKRNLDELAFFGICEYQKSSQQMFEKTFDLKFRRQFEQSDDGKAKTLAHSLDQRTKDKILSMNRLDVELYDYAINLFNKRLISLDRNRSDRN